MRYALPQLGVAKTKDVEVVLREPCFARISAFVSPVTLSPGDPYAHSTVYSMGEMRLQGSFCSWL